MSTSAATTSGIDQLIAQAVDQEKRFSDNSNKLRDRADTSAKVLGAVGSAAVAAVGYNNLTNIFPIPPGNNWIAYAIVAGILAMAVADLAFIGRIWRVTRPVVTTVDPTGIDDINGTELAIIDKIYKDYAKLNGKETLQGRFNEALTYEQQALASTNAITREIELSKAQLITAEVKATESRAAHAVIRQRVAAISIGLGTWSLALLFALGFLASALGADDLDAIRSSSNATIATSKACGDAVAVLKEQGMNPVLPSECGKSVLTGQPPNTLVKTADSDRAALLSELAQHYTDCVKSATTGSQFCQTTLRLINEASAMEDVTPKI